MRPDCERHIYREFLKAVKKPDQVRIGNLGLQVLARLKAEAGFSTPVTI